jgi:hypothetical protein
MKKGVTLKRISVEVGVVATVMATVVVMVVGVVVMVVGDMEGAVVTVVTVVGVVGVVGEVAMVEVGVEDTEVGGPVSGIKNIY